MGNYDGLLQIRRDLNTTSVRYIVWKTRQPLFYPLIVFFKIFSKILLFRSLYAIWIPSDGDFLIHRINQILSGKPDRLKYGGDKCVKYICGETPASNERDYSNLILWKTEIECISNKI